MKNIKRIKFIFTVIMACLTLAAIIHTTIAYIPLSNSGADSTPASVAFYLLIPYCVGIGICAFVGRIVLMREFKRAKQ